MNPSFEFLNAEIALSFSDVVRTLSIKILPEVGRSRRPIMFNKVDFPEPELPTTNTSSPRLIVNETSCSALIAVSASPYTLVRF